MKTGWIDEPEAAPEMPATAMLMAMAENRASGMEQAAARSRALEAREEREAARGRAHDPDEYAAGFVARGYMPGQISDLTQRLADVSAELAAEQARIERGERISERVRGMLERGQVGGLEASRMLDADLGDAQRAGQLERRAESLRRQIEAAAELVSPPQQRDADPFEAASRRAHQAFIEATRARMAAAESGYPAPRAGRRPFGYASRGDVARSESCVHCTEAGLSDEVSYLLHSDPELAVPVTTAADLAGAAEPTDADLAEFGRALGVPWRPEVSR